MLLSVRVVGSALALPVRARMSMLPGVMKRKSAKPETASDDATPAPGRTLHIEPPWSMTWMEYVDEMLEFLKSQIGPGHPLHRKKLFVAAVNKDAKAWYVEGEKESFYAIVYFGRRKRYGGKMMPLCEILPDWDAVLRRFAADARQATGGV